MFWMMHTVRDFRLVLCADVWDAVEETSVGMLKKAVAAEKATGGFHDLSEPVVVYNPRGSRPEFSEEYCAAYPHYWASL